MNSIGRLGQTFLTIGDESTSQRWLDRWDQLNESVKANNRVSARSPADPDDIDELASRLEKLDRPLESVLWKSIAAHLRGTLAAESTKFNRQRQQLVSGGGAFETDEKRLMGIDPSSFPLPVLRFEPGQSPTHRDSQSRPVVPPKFRNVSDELGIQHAYQVGSQPQSEGFAIYQTYGGAVVVLDFDRDGWSDLYFTQGGADPPGFEGSQGNELYRHTVDFGTDPSASHKMRNVSVKAGTADRRYSMGGTAGDWNQDGFPDLVIANIGEDRLMINNGDGTFKSMTIVAASDQNRVPSSVAMADLTGDHLPDILELAYVDDPKMRFRPKRNENGEVLNAMSPMQYEPGADRICINDGFGGMRVDRFTKQIKDIRTGLGLVVTDFNDQPGNEIFVGNDLYPDHLWRIDSYGQWRDVAPAAGCAFGIRGSKTASMGIAAGDLDNTGTIDLHITNYQNRNSSLFLNLGEAFLERNVQFGMAADSQAVLGFGSQTLDYDNDGDRDLVVTNGHIENSLSILDEPYRQPAQLFANLGSRFSLTDVDDPSGYWSGKHLGRALARVDFDRDGFDDFAVTHLGERSALMMNQTDSSNHWLQLRLVGSACERDAIGAKVAVIREDRVMTEWVIAGDGYFSRNDAVLSFGLGSDERADRIEVTWPDGVKQSFSQVVADRRWLIVQGHGEPFRLD